MPIIEVPVVHAAVVREFRKQLTNRTNFVAAVAVKVPEGTLAEAPLVYSAATANGSASEYRTWQGRLVRSLSVMTERGRVDVTSRDPCSVMGDFLTYASRRRAAGNSTQVPWSTGCFEAPRITHPSQHHEIQETCIVEASAQAAEEWSQAVVLDGRVYVASEGPAWTFKSRKVPRAEGVPQYIDPGYLASIAVVSELAHVEKHSRDLCFAPGDLPLARIAAAASFPNLFRIRTANSYAWDPVPGGAIEGPGVRGWRAHGTLPSREVAAASDGLLSRMADRLGQPKTTTDEIRAYADLKDAVALPMGRSGIQARLDAAVRAHGFLDLPPEKDPMRPLMEMLGMATAPVAGQEEAAALPAPGP